MSAGAGSGRPYPLGSTVVQGGINFAVFSRNATAVYLELFDAAGDQRPSRSLALDPLRNRTGDVWHIFVPGLRSGQLYGLRADGPYQPLGQGHRFNVNKLLADPYARALEGRFDLEQDAVYGYDRGSPEADLSFSGLDSAPHAARCVALGPDGFEWQDDRPLRTPPTELVIYEVHVRGFSAHPSSAARNPGTYQALIEHIPHLLDLGINAVELLPVHDFNEGEPVGVDPLTGQRLRNFWGYNTVGFFAPEDSYAVNREGGAQVQDFKEMVRQLHAAGIEVILDVVFNHTGEGHELGPTFSFRGLDNSVYYMLEGGRRYRNYSGTGNTVNCNHPVLKQLILDCLRYWVVEMHVDGFRFDLATILGRGRQGQWIGDLSLLYDIGGDPVLRGCKLIAESWDADGMYKVGGFPPGWAEWNGRFRDDLRRFLRGDPGMVPWLGRRLGGSLDLFGSKRSPARSINFVTCHDGFTLRDQVSYQRKHNLRNGEDNRDGANENFSSNWGQEGETEDPELRALRLRQGKNLLCMLMLARGTPMLLGGDELWRTKRGNNNTYCQDNELEWFDWELPAEGQQMLRFCRMLVGLRRRHPALRRPLFVDPFAAGDGPRADISWHGVVPGEPDWGHESRTLACQIHGPAPELAGGEEDDDLYAVFSAWSEPLDFGLPEPGRPGARWHRLLDTALPSPADILAEDQAPPVSGPRYRVQPRSVVLLIARPG